MMMKMRRRKKEKEWEEKKMAVKKYRYSPNWCGSVGWALSSKLKGHQFDSQSGHMPGLPARSPRSHSMFLSLSFSFPSPLSRDR